jgi:membrane-bound lytic murein transglycosylase A
MIRNVILGLALVPGLIAPALAVDSPPLVQVEPPEQLGFDDQLWGLSTGHGDRGRLLQAINHSLQYLNTAAAEAAYAQYPVAGVTRDRVRRSLLRFRHLVRTARSAPELQRWVQQEFVFYQSTGYNGLGTVSFTGYFEPTFTASRVQTAEFRYPVFREPPDLATWPLPHPTRAELEGADGLQSSQGKLRGLELVWLRDRLEAFLIQVQGSARLQLTDGSTLSIGYAGRTEYPYVSIGRELVNDGKILAEELTLPALMQYFQQHPEALSDYLPRNNRVVFFEATAGGPPLGSLRVPVTAERSIATDKTVMPPGALALIQTQIPFSNSTGALELHTVNRYVLDQDTGGAIRGAGRVDIFMGTGTQAGDRAGLVNSTGQLYYLLLRD